MNNNPFNNAPSQAPLFTVSQLQELQRQMAANTQQQQTNSANSNAQQQGNQQQQQQQQANNTNTNATATASTNNNATANSSPFMIMTQVPVQATPFAFPPNNNNNTAASQQQGQSQHPPNQQGVPNATATATTTPQNVWAANASNNANFSQLLPGQQLQQQQAMNNSNSNNNNANNTYLQQLMRNVYASQQQSQQQPQFPMQQQPMPMDTSNNSGNTNTNTNTNTTGGQLLTLGTSVRPVLIKRESSDLWQESFSSLKPAAGGQDSLNEFGWKHFWDDDDTRIDDAAAAANNNGTVATKRKLADDTSQQQQVRTRLHPSRCFAGTFHLVPFSHPSFPPLHSSNSSKTIIVPWSHRVLLLLQFVLHPCAPRRRLLLTRPTSVAAPFHEDCRIA